MFSPGYFRHIIAIYRFMLQHPLQGIWQLSFALGRSMVALDDFLFGHSYLDTFQETHIDHLKANNSGWRSLAWFFFKVWLETGSLKRSPVLSKIKILYSLFANNNKDRCVGVVICLTFCSGSQALPSDSMKMLSFFLHRGMRLAWAVRLITFLKMRRL